MKILNRESNEIFNRIEIFLTPSEAEELSERLSGLLSNPDTHHIHLDTDEYNGKYKRELIVSIYTKENLESFDERSRKLILTDQ